MHRFKKLKFQPLRGFSSRHVQTLLAAYGPTGKPAPSQKWLVHLQDGDCISCQVSTPVQWKEKEKTIVLLHGLGGSETSTYLIRLSRKFYQNGHKIVRMNMRGCGSGIGLSKMTYCAGNSGDVFQVLKSLKEESPHSEVTVIGFSLGGNIVLKMAGELGDQAHHFFHTVIAVCPPLDLAHTKVLLDAPKNYLYHYYYLKNLLAQVPSWVPKKAKTMFEFDSTVTAPLWGFKAADDYYQQCSSINYLSKVKQRAHLLFAEDDPFIPLDILHQKPLSENVNIWTTKHGGHLGFFGHTGRPFDYYWMDHLLLNWVNGDFASNAH
jgi:hypothetical protein